MNKKEILRLFAYGGSLRKAIEKITNSGRGTLIAFRNTKKLDNACKGGFKLNTDFSYEKLAELAKLDGAIVIDDKLEKILSANVLLDPNTKITSTETGTRHQASERTAKQFGVLVLAVSEKAKIATVYYGNEKFRLSSIQELFSKCGEGLKVLEKNRELFKSLIKKLDTFELLELITLEDLIYIFQRKKIMDSVVNILSIYTTELGEESDLIDLQLREIINYMSREIEYITNDYKNYFNFDKIENDLNLLKYDELLKEDNLFKIFLANKKSDHPLIPKGYRILRNIPILTEDNINALVSGFSDLKDLIAAKEEDLTKIKGINERKAKAIKEYLFKVQV